jgi:hypothetical protein
VAFTTPPIAPRAVTFLRDARGGFVRRGWPPPGQFLKRGDGARIPDSPPKGGGHSEEDARRFDSTTASRQSGIDLSKDGSQIYPAPNDSSSFICSAASRSQGSRQRRRTARSITALGSPPRQNHTRYSIGRPGWRPGSTNRLLVRSLSLTTSRAALVIENLGAFLPLVVDGFCWRRRARVRRFAFSGGEIRSEA